LTAKAEWERRRYATPEGRLYKLYHAAKTRAKRKGVRFSIKLEDIQIPAVCPLLGVPIRLGGPRRDSPSLDRINSKKGYVKGNVWIVSQRANKIKNDATLDEFEMIARNWRNELGRK
jgi:hypothetical protein